jgi:hypothetical protein
LFRKEPSVAIRKFATIVLQAIANFDFGTPAEAASAGEGFGRFSASGAASLSSIPELLGSAK